MVEFDYTPPRHNVQTYAYPVDVNFANTAAAPATLGPFTMPSGIVKRFWMDIPDGSRNHVLAQVLLGGVQWIPAAAGMYIRGNNYVFDMEQFQDIFDSNNKVTIVAWNDGLANLVLYIHHITFYFTLQLAGVL